MVVDEGCHDLSDVAGCASYADAINVKLAKCGGLREAIRMVHAARALGLGVMLGCMIESELGIAPAALFDWVDLDGHLLLADRPFAGLELSDGRVLPADAPGLGVEPVAAGGGTAAPGADAAGPSANSPAPGGDAAAPGGEPA